jgi:hypothetical protein
MLMLRRVLHGVLCGMLDRMLLGGARRWRGLRSWCRYWMLRRVPGNMVCVDLARRH